MFVNNYYSHYGIGEKLIVPCLVHKFVPTFVPK
jgi:hypothetical protein